MKLNIVRSYCAVSGIYYIVSQKNNNYFQIFKIEEFCGKKKVNFITYRDTLKSAKKLAKLLAKTYNEGFSHGNY